MRDTHIPGIKVGEPTLVDYYPKTIDIRKHGKIVRKLKDEIEFYEGLVIKMNERLMEYDDDEFLGYLEDLGLVEKEEEGTYGYDDYMYDRWKDKHYEELAAKEGQVYI